MPVVGGGGELIFKSPFLAAEVREGQADVALALVGGIVHGDHEALVLGPLPGKDQKAIMGPVAVPAGSAFEKLPLAVTKRRLPQEGQKAIIEIVQALING